jgi:hypothetical protein
VSQVLFVEDPSALLLSEIADRWQPPLVLPRHWRLIEDSLLTNECCLHWQSSLFRMKAIASACREGDGRRWLHFSLSH